MSMTIIIASYSIYCESRKSQYPLCNIHMHYIDVIVTMMASQITSLTFVYSTVYSDADQRKHQNSVSLAFVWGIHRTGEFLTQMASYAENVSIWWRHHGVIQRGLYMCHKICAKLESCKSCWIDYICVGRFIFYVFLCCQIDPSCAVKPVHVINSISLTYWLICAEISKNWGMF